MRQTSENTGGCGIGGVNDVDYVKDKITAFLI